jgi:hypothetical protein
MIRSTIITFGAITAIVAVAVLAIVIGLAIHGSPTIVKTIHGVSYHGMTCTETITNGNVYMNGCYTR